MILSFKTKFKDGEPTYFIDKIWQSLPFDLYQEVFKYDEAYCKKIGKGWDDKGILVHEKKHTIREDKHNRWHAGMKIHFTVFNRTKLMIQFAPVVECISTQTIEIFQTGVVVIITIDSKILDYPEIEKLAINDGFDNAEKFLNHFFPTFKGKIIHWTDLKY